MSEYNDSHPEIEPTEEFVKEFMKIQKEFLDSLDDPDVDSYRLGWSLSDTLMKISNSGTHYVMYSGEAHILGQDGTEVGVDLDDDQEVIVAHIDDRSLVLLIPKFSDLHDSDDGFDTFWRVFATPQNVGALGVKKGSYVEEQSQIGSSLKTARFLDFDGLSDADWQAILDSPAPAGWLPPEQRAVETQQYKPETTFKTLKEKEARDQFFISLFKGEFGDTFSDDRETACYEELDALVRYFEQRTGDLSEAADVVYRWLDQAIRDTSKAIKIRRDMSTAGSADPLTDGALAFAKGYKVHLLNTHSVRSAKDPTLGSSNPIIDKFYQHVDEGRRL